MTETIDHAAEARQIIETFHAPSPEGAQMIMEAQVHATLALVEAQRTANLIAYVQLLEMQYAEAAKRPDEFDEATRAGSIVRHGVALDRIREGLGL